MRGQTMPTKKHRPPCMSCGHPVTPSGAVTVYAGTTRRSVGRVHAVCPADCPVCDRPLIDPAGITLTRIVPVDGGVVKTHHACAPMATPDLAPMRR